MAIALEYINFIVPVSVIREKYPGGWEQCLEDHRFALGGRVRHDGLLFRDGAMSPMDMRFIVDKWMEIGIEPTACRDGEDVWKDCCVVQSMFGRPTLPCDWIEVSSDGSLAWLKV